MATKLTVLGGGESGIGAALLAQKKGYDVFLSDSQTIGEKYKNKLKQLAIAFEENGHTLDSLLQANLIVKSPGIPDDILPLQKAREKNIPIISELEFGYQNVDDKTQIIAITGTNGKTTTTLLIHHILQKAGYNVCVCGNIGTSFAAMVAQNQFEYYVVECSSFQLDGIKIFRPHVAIILNITPDHLDRYQGNMEAYIESKFRIAKNQTEKDYFIYNLDSDALVSALPKQSGKGRNLSFSLQNTTHSDIYFDPDGIKTKKEEKIPIHNIPLIGKHNIQNVMASLLASQCVGISIQAIINGVKTFKNTQHRLEIVDTIKGVTFINDSKATNVDATYFALEGIDTKIIWWVGGLDKGNDYESLKKWVEKKVKGMVCLGKNNEKIISFFGECAIPMVETQDIGQGLKQSLQWASAGDTVLLSPACASFDLFQNYEDRGNQFKEAIKKLKINLNTI